MPKMSEEDVSLVVQYLLQTDSLIVPSQALRNTLLSLSMLGAWLVMDKEAKGIDLLEQAVDSLLEAIREYKEAEGRLLEWE
jgi:hypothetical protein